MSEATGPDIEQQVFCWNNADRVCSADCVAWDPNHKVNAQETPCRILNTAALVTVRLTRIAEGIRK
jgi:hypothetical protein